MTTKSIFTEHKEIEENKNIILIEEEKKIETSSDGLYDEINQNINLQNNEEIKVVLSKKNEIRNEIILFKNEKDSKILIKENIDEFINPKITDNKKSNEKKKNKNKLLDEYKTIKNYKQLLNYYEIDKIRGDGNCVFYSLSMLIFNNDKYFNEIRQKICDYLQYYEKTKNFFLDNDEKTKYINNMRKNKAFGGITELQIFCKILNTNLLFYIRYINNKNCKKMDSDNINLMIINNNNNYEGDFELLLDDYGGKRDNLNHFQSIHNKKGIQILSEKIFEIKEYFIKQKHFYDIGKDLLKIIKEVEIKYVFDKINKKKGKEKI